MCGIKCGIWVVSPNGDNLMDQSKLNRRAMLSARLNQVLHADRMEIETRDRLETDRNGEFLPGDPEDAQVAAEESPTDIQDARYRTAE